MIRTDKGERILTGLRNAPETSHLMVVDYDDYVSRRLAGFVSSSTGPGWFVGAGYAWAGGSTAMLLRGFDRHCGSSLILERERVPVTEMAAGSPHALTDRWLGSHVYVKGDWARAGHPLRRLPFPGAVYHHDHGSNVSGTGGLREHYFGVRAIARRPHSVAARLFGLRRASRIAAEFALPLTD